MALCILLQDFAVIETCCTLWQIVYEHLLAGYFHVV